MTLSTSSKTQAPIKAPPSYIQGLIPLFVALVTGCLFRFEIPMESLLSSTLGGEKNELRWFSFSLLVMIYVANYLGSRVVDARYKHGVPLPAMYPADVKLFCNDNNNNNDDKNKEKVSVLKDPIGYLQIVRGHENFVENVSIHLGVALLLVLAPPPLYQPYMSGFGTLMFSVGRLLYARGYTSQVYGPNGRLVGLIVAFMLGTMPLVGQVMLFVAGFI